MKLSELVKHKGKKYGKKRVGRGYGSGKGGHTSGLGTKGQKARGKRKVALGFEGGQIPLYKKMPKRSSFRGAKRKDVEYISLVKLNKFKDGDKVTPEKLLKKRILDRLPRHGVKILSNGELHKKLELEGFLITKGAREKIEKSESKIIESK